LIGGSGNDRLLGDAGRDLLRGGNGRDQLFGGGGNDTLFGNAGDDVLSGGRGNDQLTGGRGSDTFVFNRREGNDTITDFAVNEDVLQLRLALVGSARTGGSVVSRFGRVEDDDFILDFGAAGTTIRLEGLAVIDTDLLAGRIEFI
jgi:Ca2+-binding RTX toxin-like protein